MVDRFLDDALRDKAEALAAQLASVTLDAVLIRDYGSLERHVETQIGQKDVLAVAIAREDGDILAAAQRQDAFRDGVLDIILKPFDTADVRAAFARVHNLLRHRARVERLEARLRLLDDEDKPAPRPVMDSRTMQRTVRLLEQVSADDLPVLLSGETGTGKGLLARFLHDLGPRRSGPYLAINCGGIAPSLVESELFGHEKGAFTGASARKRGLLELADGGTLLLDEINSAPPEVQVRLLQFLQDRTLMRVGGQSSVRVDVRLVCATNQPLKDLVEGGGFRSDLYYRLNVFPVDVPPLRERREDVVPLAEHFLLAAAHRLSRPVTGFSDAALRCLVGYDWPGNVRELENVIQRAVVLAADGAVDGEHLPVELCRRGARTSAALPFHPDATLAEVEDAWVRHMLDRCCGNKAEAARRLGIDPSTLHRRLRKS